MSLVTLEDGGWWNIHGGIGNLGETEPSAMTLVSDGTKTATLYMTRRNAERLVDLLSRGRRGRIRCPFDGFLSVVPPEVFVREADGPRPRQGKRLRLRMTPEQGRHALAAVVSCCEASARIRKMALAQVRVPTSAPLCSPAERRRFLKAKEAYDQKGA